MPATDALPPLPDGCPRDWAVRPPEPSDVRAVFELVAACDEAVLGYPDISLADVEGDLAQDSHRQLVVVDGLRVLAWVWLEDRAAGRTSADVYVDPHLTEREPDLADRLAQWGWDRARGAAAGIARERGIDSTGLETGTIDGDAVAARRAAAAGFSRTRTFWRMQRPLTADDAVLGPAPGVVIRSWTEPDARTTYEIIESAFADHWNHHPRSYDEWWDQQSNRPGYDPRLWWLAEVDGRPVGALIASRQMADEDAIYIATLGTLRAARGRGVGKALLRKAFAAGVELGWRTAKLNVDSSSSTSAPALYGGVGMTVEFAMHAWQRDVPAD